MSQTQLIATTAVVGFRALGEGGQQVIDAERQILSAIRSRIGEAQASLFARPVRQAGGQQIAWYATGSGEVRALLDTDEAGHEAIQKRVEATLLEVRGLSQQLLQRSGRAAHLGQLLGFAARPVTPEMIYLLGDQPVLVLWGYEPDSTSAPVVAATPQVAALAQATPGSAQEVEPEAVSAQGATLSSLGVGDTPVAGRGMSWWRWLLLLLMLGVLVYLVLRALTPLAAIKRVQALPPQELGKDIAAQEQRIDGLSEQFAGLQRRRDVLLEQCTAQATPAPIEAPPIEPVARIETPGPVRESTPPPVATIPPRVEPVAESGLPKSEDIPPSPPAKVEPAVPPPAKLPFEEFLKKKVPQIAQTPEPPASPDSGKAPSREVQQCRTRKKHEAPEVVLVVDASGSMGHPITGAANRMQASKRAIGEMVNRLPRDVDVGLIEFSDCNTVRRDNFYATPKRPQLLSRVDGLQPGRRTPLAHAVRRAGGVISKSVQGVIVVVTDGADSCGGDACAAASDIARTKPNVTINVIDISGSEANPTAQCIVRSTNGQVFRPDSMSDMRDMIKRAAGQPDKAECE